MSKKDQRSQNTLPTQKKSSRRKNRTCKQAVFLMLFKALEYTSVAIRFVQAISEFFQ